MIKEQLNNDLKEAMRAKEALRRDAIRMMLTALKNAEIEQSGALSDEEVAVLLQKQAKQRRDSITAYEQGGRPELAAAEQAELEIIESYLPQQLSEEEIRAIVRATIERVGATSAKDIGKVMGPLMGQMRGKADGTLVQRLVREELGA
ncbi:MAG: GatB/YqeY domain-containing protein [Ardenticatenales bacterium]|nr:GatB/YqeY domain-containing protein [Ardenticatenales bacterium]